jgi:hypothetical protein
MSRQDNGTIQLGGLTAEASWRYVDGLLCLRIPSSSFNGEQREQVERLCAESEPLFLLWNGSADSDHRIVGFERNLGVVTFFLTKTGSPSRSEADGGTQA